MDFLNCPADTGLRRLHYSCTTKDASSNEHINPEPWTINQPNPIYSFTWYLPAIFPCTTISSHAWKTLLSEASSSSHVEYLIARHRGPLSSETSTDPCLTASNHEICYISIMCATLLHPNLSHMDFLDVTAAIHGSRLIISDTTKKRELKRIDQSRDIDE